MSNDFQENGERLLKDTRADVVLVHQRIERLNAKLVSLTAAFVISLIFAAAAIWLTRAH